MYKKTKQTKNAFLPLSMISENSSGYEMFNNYCEKLKNENCAHCNHSAGCTCEEKKIIQRRENA